MNNNFVPALPVKMDTPAPNTKLETNLEVPMSATQHVELRTSGVDRAKGYLLSTLPLCGAFGVAVVAVAVVGAGVPLMSLVTLAIFWLSFVAAWLLGYCYTLHVSPEGVSLYEARRKWDLLFLHHDRLWEDHNRKIGGE